MPFGIRRGGGDCAFEVYNEATDARAEGGCHESRADALAHQRALQANTSDEKKKADVTDAVDAEAPEVALVEAEPGEHFHAVAHTEGTSTGLRTFTNLDWREPPFAFHWQKKSTAHGGTPEVVQVGLVTRALRDPEDPQIIHAFGKIDLADPDGTEYARKLAEGFARWVSIGLDESPAEMTTEWADDDGGEDDPLGLSRTPKQINIDGGKIGELSGVSVPAQADATVEPTPELMALFEAAGDAASKENPFAKNKGNGDGEDKAKPDDDGESDDECPDGHVFDPDTGECVAQSDAAPKKDGGEDSEGDANSKLGYGKKRRLRVMGTTVEWVDDAANPNHDKTGRFDHAPGGAKAKKGGESGGKGRFSDIPPDRRLTDEEVEYFFNKKAKKGPDGWPMKDPEIARLTEKQKEQIRQGPKRRVHGDESVEVDEYSMADIVEGMTAAAYRIEIPDLPPASWFEEPTDVEIPGAFCVTDDGRIYGILAPLKTNHRAYAGSGRQRYVPNRTVDYSRFLGGEALTSTGRIHNVGPITMDCGHAGRFRSDGEVAPAHYENACSVVGKVRVGETAEGLPWVAGALEPGVTPSQISRMLACRLSGDWQPHSDQPGMDELIACLLVPSPGFPMGRTGPTVTTDREGALVASAMPVRYVGDSDIGFVHPVDAIRAAAEWAGRTDYARAARRLNAAKLPVAK